MKVLTADQAASLIKDEWNLTISGFGHCGAPEALMAAVERRYLNTGAPRDLSLMFASGAGDRDVNGLNRLAHRGLIQRIIGGFWSLAPRIGQMAAANQIEAHNWPQGVVSHMFRAIAAGLPGVISEVGLGTFIDPAQRGGCLNVLTKEPLIERIQLTGRSSLLYRAMPLHCALLRGTRADENGNITMEREANLQDVLAQAQAVRNSGGIVIVQVMEIACAGSIPPNLVQIPGILVDYVVVAEHESHRQTYGQPYSPMYSGEWARGKGNLNDSRSSNDESTQARRVIGRRALYELMNLVNEQHRHRSLVVNLGIGTPEEIARQAKIDGSLRPHGFTLTVESGAIGGRPAGGMSFGATAYPEAIITQAELFDFYDGGGIDIAFLGFGQIDRHGRINVANLGDRLNGVGGFVNISRAAKRLVFCGSFTASGLRIAQDPYAGIKIEREGKLHKLIDNVSHICYDPAGQVRCHDPLVITERAVMRCSANGLEVLEIAPGIDLQCDVLNRADFPLSVSPNLKTMPASVFADGDVCMPFVS